MIPKLQGIDLAELPKDLYIPPNAMLVMLEIFEGPLDLLLYLIRKQNLDILDIQVSSITKQYINYIELMCYTNLELTSDYLEMAAILTEIKSKMLLPKLPNEITEEDPRQSLIRRLQEYEQIKIAAEKLNNIPRQDRDFFYMQINCTNLNLAVVAPHVELSELLSALKNALATADLKIAHNIINESLSIRDKMTNIIANVQNFPNKFFKLSDFFNTQEGRLGIIVTFLALLELLKENLLEIIQAEPFGAIYIKQADSSLITTQQLQLC